MRTIFFAVLLFLDLALFGQGVNYMAPPIPSGGLVQTIDSLTSPDNVFVGTGNAVVNLGSNSYSIQFQGTPAAGTNFICRFDATKLTAVAGNVNIFGLTPLADYPNQGVYYIRYQVSGTRSNNKTVFVSYVSSMVALNTVNTTPKFNNGIKVYGSSKYQPSGSAIVAGQVVKATDDSGTLGYSSCSPWYVCGNSGLSRVNYLGTSDSVDLRFGVGGIAAGIVSYITSNTALGVGALLSTTGVDNTAIGNSSMFANTSGLDNTSVGAASLEANTTGSYNTSIGNGCAISITTGSYNTGIGQTSLQSLTTGSNNVGIGQCAVQSSGVSNSVAIGTNATVGDFGIALGSNASTQMDRQLAISPNVENILWKGHSTGVGYALVDSSGTGNFIPIKPFAYGLTTTSPVTGDSIVITTSKNTVNSAGTLANLTIVLPANPIAGQVYYFSFEQAITTLHYSVRLSGGANPLGLPVSEPQYGCFSVYYDNNINTWVAASH